jgi:hypothetical protein
VENGELPLQADFDVYLDFVRQNPERFCLPEPHGTQDLPPTGSAA